MPCLRVYTNVDTDKATQVAFLKDASAMLAKELRKPEGYVTVCMVPGQVMLWGGDDVPCAQVYIMSLGGLSPEINARISSKFSQLLAKHLKISSDHYYIHFIDCEGHMIGYDGETF